MRLRRENNKVYVLSNFADSSLVMTPASNPVNKLLMALPNPVEERGMI